MDLKIKLDSKGINWGDVTQILKKGGMAYHTHEIHQKAFENSHTAVFAFDGYNLIGIGRAISDGTYQAAIYDMAILPEYQGKGLGRIIMQHILKNIGNYNIIGYAAGMEEFYKKFGFRKMKTGMALFQKHEKMHKKGFIE